MPMPRNNRVSVPVPAVRHESCWAKTTESGRPGISVEQHCRTAGVIAGMLADSLPAWMRQELGVQNGVVLAALHDVGKVAPGFQSKCPAWLKQHGIAAASCAGLADDHGKIGQQAVQDMLGTDVLRFWAMIVGGHHGILKGDRVAGLVAGGPGWDTERKRWIETLREGRERY
jgi:CRISPR-associated endonuclease/helicase Cas3